MWWLVVTHPVSNWVRSCLTSSEFECNKERSHYTTLLPTKLQSKTVWLDLPWGCEVARHTWSIYRYQLTNESPPSRISTNHDFSSQYPRHTCSFYITDIWLMFECNLCICLFLQGKAGFDLKTKSWNIKNLHPTSWCREYDYHQSVIFI